MSRPIGQVWFTGVLALVACSRRADDPPAKAADTSPTQTPASDAPAKSPASEWQIVPGRAGPITPATSEAELRQRYDSSIVESTRIDIGEGETAAGTVLYPADSLRRVITDWKGGALAGPLTGIKLYLDPGSAQYESKAYTNSTPGLPRSLWISRAGEP